MGVLVSPMLGYLEKNPSYQVPFSQMENELQHLSYRERIGTGVAIISVLFGILSLGAVIVGGPFLMGALFAIALIAAAYSYCCRLAEMGLRNKVNPQQVQTTLPAQAQQVLTGSATTVT